MTDFKEILISHAAAYPLMKPCDGVKLVYQATFGGGHMISDADAAHRRIITEYAAIPHTAAPMRVESLGDTARVYLDGELSQYELSLIARMFCASAKRYARGYVDADETTRLKFDERLCMLGEVCKEGHFAFTPAELNAYISEYRAAGCPAVSHSDVYRDSYLPAYRVIDSYYVRLIPALVRLTALLPSSERVVVAIDGRCASGKSTAARLIADVFSAETVHMDDFFLPPELRTPERLSEVGGNLHRERFVSEVLPHLRDTGGFSYRVFECSTFSYADKPRYVAPSKLIICEGSYALHPAFGKYYDMAIFSDVDPDEQCRRILLRNGEYMLTRFKNEWIPMEERYFEAFGIKDKCDLTI
ncbi:MAG: hypothetical protein IJ428_00695 [Clostridia bacterium]|nr:hypothetical protein [Clostridia bacterium]